DVSYTKVTTDCIRYLNEFKLESLIISGCYEISDLKELNMPSLTKLDFSCSIMDDNKIKPALNKKLKVLDLSYDYAITDETLKYIRDNELIFDELQLAGTRVTNDGVKKYLSHMKLLKISLTSKFNY